MNISTIADMIATDPTILNDIPAFLTRMNRRDQNQVRRKHVEVIDEQVVVSLAEMNGGPATAADVQAARIVVQAQPLVLKAQGVLDAVQAAINSGSVTNLATLKSAFQTAVAAVS